MPSSRSVCLCLYNWYGVGVSNKMDDDDDDGKVTKHLITKPNGSTTYATVIHPLPGIQRVSFAGAAMIDHFIYVVGGGKSFEYSKKVDRYDIRSGKCFSCPPMMVGRDSPLVAVLGDKLFVMGGTNDDDDDEWAEVFDVQSQEWKLLPPPLVTPARETRFYAVDNERKLILAGDRDGAPVDVYSFHMPTQVWQFFDELNVNLDLFDEAIVVDKIMYYWSFGVLHYYNTDTQDKFKTTIKGLKGEGSVNTWHCKGPKLLHLWGDRFCLVWLDHKYHTLDGNNYSHLLCTTIRTSVGADNNGEVSFSASVENSQSYLVLDRHDIEVEHAFLM